jgi:hypothetical protein
MEKGIHEISDETEGRGNTELHRVDHGYALVVDPQMSIDHENAEVVESCS